MLEWCGLCGVVALSLDWPLRLSGRLFGFRVCHDGYQEILSLGKMHDHQIKKK